MRLPSKGSRSMKIFLGSCSCENYGPFLGPYYNAAPTIYGTQKGTLILTTTHMLFSKGPALKYSLYRYIGPKVYAIWVHGHGPLGVMCVCVR